MKKFIFRFIYWNVEIFTFFFPFKKEFDLIKSNYKKKFSIKFYYLFRNFDFFLKIKFLLFLLFIQIIPLFLYLKFFKNLSLENKNNIISKIRNLKINNLSRGLLAIESQSMIINYSIFNLSIKNEN